MQRRFKEGANYYTWTGFFIALVSMDMQNLKLREEEIAMQKKERLFWVLSIIVVVLTWGGSPFVWAGERSFI
jgi:cytochrome c oxidase assembly factor CtaG